MGNSITCLAPEQETKPIQTDKAKGHIGHFSPYEITGGRERQAEIEDGRKNVCISFLPIKVGSPWGPRRYCSLVSKKQSSHIFLKFQFAVNMRNENRRTVVRPL